jgi:hypothetical protein
MVEEGIGVEEVVELDHIRMRKKAQRADLLFEGIQERLVFKRAVDKLQRKRRVLHIQTGLDGIHNGKAPAANLLFKNETMLVQSLGSLNKLRSSRLHRVRSL